MNPSTAFGLAFCDELARCGLREVVLAPGSRSTPLAMAFSALEQRGRLRLHFRIDERSASFAALGSSSSEERPTSHGAGRQAGAMMRYVPVDAKSARRPATNAPSHS